MSDEQTPEMQNPEAATPGLDEQSEDQDSASTSCRNPLDLAEHRIEYLDEYVNQYGWSPPAVWDRAAIIDRVGRALEPRYRSETIEKSKEIDLLDVFECEGVMKRLSEADPKNPDALVRAQDELDRARREAVHLRLTDAAIREMLATSEKGKLLAHGVNVAKILSHSHETAGFLRWNEITRSIEVTGGRFKGHQANGLDVAVSNWLADHWSLYVGHEVVGTQLLYLATLRSYDPVKEYLDSLVWDGKPRIDTC